MRWLASLILLTLAAVGAQAQSSTLTGPSLGFTTADAGASIRPIIGIPGASLLGERLLLDTNIGTTVISPKQNYAIAVRNEDGQVIFIDLSADPPVVSTVKGAYPGPSLAAISPSGLVAAVYSHETRRIQVIGNLPYAEITQQFDVSHIPGLPSSLAVSDDGAFAVLRLAGEQAALWVIDSSGGSWPMPLAQPAAAAFVPKRSDVVLTDDATQQAFLFPDAGRAGIQIPLISAEDGIRSFAAVAASEDGRRIFLADSDSGNVAVVDMETLRAAVISCNCSISGLHRLKGTSVFRLNEASQEPIVVLDASGADPRFVLVPPSASDATEAR